MDKRKTADVFRCEKVSPAYFYEQTRLRRRLDEYEKEQNKCLRKISISQEALSTGAFVKQTTSSQSVKLSNLSRRHFTKLDQPGYQENIKICETKVRKLSVDSATKQRTLCVTNQKKATRQLSDPLPFFRNESLKGNVIAISRRKLTSSGIDKSVPPKNTSFNSCCSDKMKSDLSKNQSTTGNNFFGTKLPRQQASTFSDAPPSHPKSEHLKINFATRLSTSLSTQTKMFNETSAEEQCKHENDSLENAPAKNLLYHRVKLSDDILPRFQNSLNVSNEKQENPNGKTENIIEEIAGSFVITKGQFQDTKMKVGKVEELLSMGTEDPCSELEINQASGIKKDAGNLNKSVFRKSIFPTHESKRHLHIQTDVPLAAGEVKGVCYPGNAWGDNDKGDSEISTIEALQEIAIDKHSSLSKKQNKNDKHLSSPEQNSKALRKFRRLTFAAVAAERFNRKNFFNPSSENRGDIVPKRKLFVKARLEELQRPTESFLRQIVGEETATKPPVLKTRSKSVGGLTSTNGPSKYRRASQAAIATRILIDRESRKVVGGGFANFGSGKEANEGKTLAETLNELKDCRYLRSSTLDQK